MTRRTRKVIPGLKATKAFYLDDLSSIYLATCTPCMRKIQHLDTQIFLTSVKWRRHYEWQLSSIQRHIGS